MNIDWFTVIAQIINFLILVFLLKYFLYKPILNAIEEREKKIKSQLEDAEAKKAEAKKEREEFKQKNDEFNKQKKELIDKATAESNATGEKIIEEAKKSAIALQAKMEKAAKDALDNSNREIAKKTRQEVFAISRKALSDLASVTLEEQSVAVFISRLTALNEDEQKQLKEAFKAHNNPLLIRSAFELPHKQQLEIKHSVKQILGTKTHFEFETIPELICGIELTANGYKLAWSISEYLNSMEKNSVEIIKEKTAPEAKN